MKTFIINNSIALFAAVLGIINFIHNFCLGRRDNANLKARSWFYRKHKRDDRQYPAMIKIEAVNMGRRPIVITCLGINYEDGSWKGTYIGKDDKGITLQEMEKYSTDSEDIDHMLFDAENGVSAKDIWFQDTAGSKHRVKDAKKNLKNFFKA